MRIVLLILALLGFAFCVFAFGVGRTAVTEIEALIGALIGVCGLGASEIVAVVQKLRDDTVRLHEIDAIERKQRDLAAKAG